MGLAWLLASCKHGSPVGAPAHGVAPCPARTFAIAGACLSADEAGDYCGKGARPEAGGCVLASCANGEPTDVTTGECIPALTVRKMALAQHLTLKDDAALGCPDPRRFTPTQAAHASTEAGTEAGAPAETTLVLDAAHYACIPRAASCGRRTRLRARALFRENGF